MSGETLKPCPFCGARLGDNPVFATRHTRFFIPTTDPDRIDAWNTRPTPTVEAGGLVQRLRFLADEVRGFSYRPAGSCRIDVADMRTIVEAADALASRDAEIERLRKELGHVEASIQTAHLRRLKAERDVAEAERHRYAFALGVSEKALEYAADIRFLELAEGSQLTVIDRQMLGELHNGSMSALSTIKTAREG